MPHHQIKFHTQFLHTYNMHAQNFKVEINFVDLFIPYTNYIFTHERSTVNPNYHVVIYIIYIVAT